MTSVFITHTLRPKHCDPLFLLQELKRSHEYCALLESADRAHGRNDLSFLAIGAREVIRHDPSEKNNDILAELRQKTAAGRQAGQLTMGYIGFLSFEAARHFDDIALTPDPDVPDALFVLPEVLLRIDHNAHTVTLTAHADTVLSIDDIVTTIERSPFLDDAPTRAIATATLPDLGDIEPLRQTSRMQFCKNVEAAREQILAGEAFQIVLSQQLRLPAGPDPVAVYERLRGINPSPYMYYFQTPDRTIVGASPETLLRVDGDHMLYRPIAGTRKRGGDKAKDDAMREELLGNAKERCEHQMLVDLGRNDIGRVAEIGSVRVHDPFHIETYAHVFHIVSDVTGTLRKDLSALDALQAVFPAGTLSGAPKLRAMEILSKLEGAPRGVYGGAFGYVDLNGNIDFAITIRTLIFDQRGISLNVGAGIVKDSIAEHEDNECLHKARSCLAAVFSARQ